jgi:hypothetical protein
MEELETRKISNAFTLAYQVTSFCLFFSAFDSAAVLISITFSF